MTKTDTPTDAPTTLAGWGAWDDYMEIALAAEMAKPEDGR